MRHDILSSSLGLRSFVRGRFFESRSRSRSCRARKIESSGGGFEPQFCSESSGNEWSSLKGITGRYKGQKTFRKHWQAGKANKQHRMVRGDECRHKCTHPGTTSAAENSGEWMGKMTGRFFGPDSFLTATGGAGHCRVHFMGASYSHSYLALCSSVGFARVIFKYVTTSNSIMNAKGS